MSARHSASRLAAWILAVSTLGTSAVAGSERQQPAVLDLVINKVPHGEIVVHIGEGEIWCDVAALERAGVRGFAGDRETRGNRVLVGLRSLAPAVRFELDETALELRLTVAPALFGKTERNILSERPPGIEQQHVPSAFLNYGASLATSGSNAVTIEGGVSARGALLTSTAFSDLAGRFLRGQTSVTVDDQRRMNRLIVGDTVAATGALGGSVQLAGVSVSHLKTLFRQSTGMPVHQYVLRRRVERAKLLLQDRSLSIAQVAFAAGFAHQSHLARHMRKILGCTPAVVRQELMSHMQ